MRGFIIVIFSLFLLLSVSSFSARAQEHSRVAAVVGNEIITSTEVDKAVSRLQNALAARDSRLSQTEIRRIVLNRLIEDLLFKQVLSKANLNLSEEALDQQVQAMMERTNLDQRALAAELARQGMTMDEYRQDLRMEILKRRLLERVVTNRIVISDEQVMEYLRANPGQNTMEEMHLYAIFLPVPSDAGLKPQMEESVNKLHQALLAGEDFSRLAAQISRGPGAAQGGDLGIINTSDMLPVMRQAVDGLQPGQISPVVQLPDNYIIFLRAKDDLPAAPVEAGSAGQTPDPEQIRRVRALLAKQATEQRFNEWMKQVRSSIYVKVLD
jgi:peptidyl-prolyl cis-trans isomerase SurA